MINLCTASKKNGILCCNKKYNGSNFCYIHGWSPGICTYVDYGADKGKRCRRHKFNETSLCSKHSPHCMFPNCERITYDSFCIEHSE